MTRIRIQYVEDSKTTCEEDLFGAWEEKNIVKDGGAEVGRQQQVDIIMSRPRMHVC